MRCVTGSPPSPASVRGAGGEGETCQTGVIGDLLQSAADRLATALGLDRRASRLEVHILAAQALGVARSWLIGHDPDVLGPAQAAALEALVRRREVGEPVAYILGEREFYGRAFKVSPDVLIPRPETELLVEAALARLPKDRPAKVLDLGTGSGCIALTLALERPDCAVTAIDLSPAALAVARENARRLGARVDFRPSDLYSALDGEAFDLIVSNPPYVAEGDVHLASGDLPWEPRLALASGIDGLDALRRIVARAPAHLTGAGWLCLEHGWDQGAAVRALLGQTGFCRPETLPDLAGRPRVTLGLAGADAAWGRTTT